MKLKILRKSKCQLSCDNNGLIEFVRAVRKAGCCWVNWENPAVWESMVWTTRKIWQVRGMMGL